MHAPFYGREKELALLRERLEMKIASLVVIKGRRRIGKSRLAEEFCKPFKSIIIEGLPPAALQETSYHQKQHFANALERATGQHIVKMDDWDDLFWHLAECTKEGRFVIVLDEINWMGSKDPTFLGKLKTAWDIWFKKNPQLILILSGSMSAWIETNILSSTGFFGRISLVLTLNELPLHACNHFWRPFEALTSPFGKFMILSITGGVPRYLEEIDPKIPAKQMIHRLCFRPEGLLFHEFERIFTDLFSKRSAVYKKIVARLAQGSATIQQICTTLDAEKGGGISEYLADLEETQYVQRHYTWDLVDGKPSKLSFYRLKDNYMRFYLKYIEPHTQTIEKGGMAHLPAWGTTMGLQFENLVLSNCHSLYRLLKIPLHEIIQDGPFYQSATKMRQGCQIDYLLQLQYNALYICEIKYSTKPIGVKVIQEVQEKMKRLSLPKQQYSLRPVLIHVNGVTDAVRSSAFFTNIIDFSELLYNHSPV